MLSLQPDCPPVLCATAPAGDTFLGFLITQTKLCCCITELHPIMCRQDVASVVDQCQELKQAPGFPRINIVIICNLHKDNN